MSREWLRAATQAIFKAAVEASKPDEAVRRYVKCSADELVVGDTRLKVPRRAFVVGFGKAPNHFGNQHAQYDDKEKHTGSSDDFCCKLIESHLQMSFLIALVNIIQLVFGHIISKYCDQ